MNKIIFGWGVLSIAALAGAAAEPDTNRPAGSFLRFRVDQLPTNQAKLNITADMKINRSPWQLGGLKLTPAPVTNTGWTPWVDLAKQPGGASGSLLLAIPAGAKGLTRFSVSSNDAGLVRDIAWDEPDGARIVVRPGFNVVRPFREQERLYYLRSVKLTGGRLLPLTRPPLFFGNAWGKTEGPGAEYMVKSFRLMGLNSVNTLKDAAKYEQLYGWTAHEGQYQPPAFMPYDEEAARARYLAAYSNFAANCAPGVRIWQMSDEPGEMGIKTNDAAAAPGFRRWLEARGLKPKLFGQSAWDGVDLLLKDPGTNSAAANRLYYWSRRYQQYLTPKMYSLAAEAIRKYAPNPAIQSFVALSGHALYMPSRMPLDMFQLAQYPGLMPGVSDWMTGGSWNWDSHQAVAFSVAPYNAGARRYGADFGKPPLSDCMMHCVEPSLFRAYTQLANQCKYISYYNYGPDYEVTEGFWSHSDGAASVVQRVGNQAALVDDLLGPGRLRPSRVAMLYSMAQETWWPQGTFADKRATFLALSHEYFQPELVTEEQIAAGALEHYSALVLLEEYITQSVQDRIAAWVKGGGLLWACDDAAVRNEYREPVDMLEQLAGLKRVPFTVAGPLRFVPDAGETAFKEHEVPVRPRMTMTNWPGARVRGNYMLPTNWTGDQICAPALAEKAVGKGKLVYLGHRAGLSYSARAGRHGAFRWWPPDRRELLSVPLLEAKVERELTVSEPMVMTGVLGTEAGSVLILYHAYYAYQARSNLTVTLKEPAAPHSVQQVEDGKLLDVPFSYADGRVTLTNWTLPWNGTVLAVRRKPAPPDERPAAMRAAAEKNLADQDWQAASAGAWFAGFFPEWQLGPRVAPLLAHEHWAVRRSAAEALGRMGHKDGAGALRAALEKETDSHALADELYALAQLDPGDARKLCRRYAKHADPFVRESVQRVENLLEPKKP